MYSVRNALIGNVVLVVVNDVASVVADRFVANAIVVISRHRAMKLP
jgi:hypothetical protein